MAYIHYNNGTVEVINRLVLRALRTMISELRWKKSEWHHLVPTVQHFLNHKPQRRLNWNAPITVMSGLARDDPINLLSNSPDRRGFEQVKVDIITEHLDELNDQLNTMHRDMDQMTASQREIHRRYASKASQPVNFGVGDYVLVAIPDTPKQLKLTMRWQGPYKVVEARDMYVFNVEDIVTNERQLIHGSRLRLYADSQLNVTVDIQQQKQHDAQGGLYSI